MLHVDLLGVPQLFIDAKQMRFPLNKPASLMAYLACKQDWVSRDELLLVYYPDADEKTARHRLRQLAYRAKKFSWATTLEITDTSLRWQVSTDLQGLLEAYTHKDYEEALELYKGELLQGLSLKDSLGFETWLELQRSHLSEKCLDAALKASERLEQDGDYEEATRLVLQQQRFHPFSESLLRALMRFCYLNNDADAALKHYDRFAVLVAEELAIKPSDLSAELARKISSGERLDEKRQHNLRAQATAFVGRHKELTELSQLLAQKDCRMITLLGTGGMGKSRLSLALAEQQLSKFKDGVFFAALASLNRAESLPTAIAEAIGIQLQASTPAKQQVLDYLREKNILLVLDNFEHLLDASLYLAELLEQCHLLKVLVSSREPLKVRAEYPVAVKGLDLAKTNLVTQSSSVQLFLQSAKRVNQAFDGVEHASDIIEICQLVEGMPLAIELAASWVTLLTPKAIAKEIKHDLHFLSTDLQDYPERHKNIYALMQASWQRLNPEAQLVLAALSVFVAPFSKEAALQISRASLRQLLLLEQRLLLRKNQQGLFDMHPLVRQFAHAKLTDQPEQFEHCQHQMQDYFCDFLIKQKDQFSQEGLYLENINEQLKNISESLSVITSEQPELLTALNVLQGFYIHKGKLQEGLDIFTKLCKNLILEQETTLKYCQLIQLSFLDRAGYSVNHDLLAELSQYYKQESPTERYIECLYLKAEVFRSQGKHKKAKQMLISSLKKVTQPQLKLDMLESLGGSCQRLSQWQEAQEAFQEALDLSLLLKDKRQYAQITLRFADLWADLGDYPKAIKAFDESLDIYEALDAPFKISWAFNNLATIYHIQKDYANAKQYYVKSQRISEHIGDRHGLALASMNLAELAHDQMNYREAVSLYEQTMTLYQGLEDALHEIKIQALLATSHLATQNLSLAKQHLVLALKRAKDLGLDSLSLDVIFHTALYLKAVEQKDAKQSLSIVWHHPSSTEDQRVLIKNYLKTDKPDLNKVDLPELNHYMTLLLAEF